MEYTYIENIDYEGRVFSIQRSDGLSIPLDSANSDYQVYLNKATLASELSNPSTPQAGE